MAKQYPEFVTRLADTDPQFFEEVVGIYDLAVGPGELDAKTKILISLTADALVGATNGVKALARIARGMGISDRQIAEALRIAYLVAGNKVLEASRAAFDE